MNYQSMLSAGMVILLVTSCTQQPTDSMEKQLMKPTPPIAKKFPKNVTVHNDSRMDDYFWLREKENPEVIAYLEAENTYTEAMTAHTSDLQNTLYEEIKGRIKETDSSVPVKIDDYYYYSRTEEGKQYDINCRKKGSLDAEEEIILDENALAEGQEYFRIGIYEMSPDHSLLAYSVDLNGSEIYTLRFKDLETGEMLTDEITGVYYSFEWANDNKTVFYSTLGDAHRPDKIWRHVLGAGENDVEIFYEPDDSYFVGLDKTKDNQFVFIGLGNNNTSEFHYLDADNPRDDFQLFSERVDGVEYNVYHRHGYFYVLTNENAINFKLMRTTVENPEKQNWETVLDHRPETKLDGVDAFNHHMAIYEKTDGLDRIRIMGYST